MKKKTATTIGTGWLIVLLVFSTSQLIGITQGGNASVTYCPNPPPEMTDGEDDYSLEVTDMINYYIENYGDFSYSTNEQESDVTRTRVGDLAYYVETNYDYGTVFYKGHSAHYNCTEEYGGKIHGFIMDYTGQEAGNIQDAYIWTKTINNKHDFVFLWSCGQASIEMYDQFPGGYCTECYSGRGMTYAWEKITGISEDGYGDPDPPNINVFLGYNWSSPNFKTYTGYLSWDYGDFAVYFYKYLLQYNKTVNQALDSTSWDTMHVWLFRDTDLRKGMEGINGIITALKVFGNGNVKLPTS
jgi:hypothetical protein